MVLQVLEPFKLRTSTSFLNYIYYIGHLRKRWCKPGCAICQLIYTNRIFNIPKFTKKMRKFEILTVQFSPYFVIQIFKSCPLKSYCACSHISVFAVYLFLYFEFLLFCLVYFLWWYILHIQKNILKFIFCRLYFKISYILSFVQWC